ncbi:MAG: protein kinase [Ktedonobacteraceae bacterium]|nr:protein kinase [Ktedonobacteraceae bacterium]
MRNNETMQNVTSGVLGRYRVLSRIGRGGMGDVWLCDDPRLRRQVAVKTLPPHNQHDHEYSARFEREAQAAAALNHPHILPVHDYGEQQLPDGRVITYIVMPYIGGGSLADRINQLAAAHQGMRQDEALNFLSQAAEAIDYAHSQGVIHRDIKPANMLLRSNDWLVLADFGIARIVSSTDNLTQAGSGIGTPEYMAPEQAQGHAVGASDNYSLAVIAYQFLTGRPPFSAETSYATIIQHLVMQPPSPRQFNPALPPACEAVLLRGLAKNPAERYPTARAFVDELKRSLAYPVSEPLFAANPSMQSADPQTPSTLQNVQALSVWPEDSKGLADGGSKLTSPEVAKQIARRRVLIGAAATLVVAGTAGGLWVLSRQGKLPFITQASPVPTKAPVQKTPTLAPNPDGPAMILREHNRPANALMWFPGKNVLISASDDHMIKEWDIQVLQQQHKKEYGSTASHTTRGFGMKMAWSQDGQYLALANARSGNDLNSTYIDIYKSDLSTRAPGWPEGILIPALSVKGVSWLQNKYIAVLWNTLKDNEQFHLGLWDVTQPALNLKPATLKGFPTIVLSGNVQDLLTRPDGTQVAIPTSDGVLVGTASPLNGAVNWKASYPEPLKNKKDSFFNEVDALAWTASGNGLIGIINASPSYLLIGWSLKDNPVTPYQFGLPGDNMRFTAIATYPTKDKAQFAAGAKDGKVYIWQTDRSTLPVRTLTNGGLEKGGVTALAWSPDGQWLAAAYDDADASILLWNV